jgi:hypothetical protein
MAARIRDLWKRDPLVVIAASLFVGAFLWIAYPTNYFETFPVWFEWRDLKYSIGTGSSYQVERLGFGVLLPIVEIEWCSGTNTQGSQLCRMINPFPSIRLDFYQWFGSFNREAERWGDRLIPAAALVISSGFLLLLRLRPITSRR